jgi:hypothetical protein
LVMLRLAIENNAFLRVVLSNQLLIMQKLELDRRLPEPFRDLIIDDIGNPDKELRDLLKGVDVVFNEVNRRMEEYAVEKDSSLDRPKDLYLIKSRKSVRDLSRKVKSVLAYTLLSVKVSEF